MANKELQKKVSVKTIKDYFHLKQLCGDENSLKRWAIAPDVDRPGLELAGVKVGTDLKRVVLIGNKEKETVQKEFEKIKESWCLDEETNKKIHYINTINPSIQKERYIKNLPV